MYAVLMLDFLVRAIEFACQARKRPPLRLALVDLRAFDPRYINRPWAIVSSLDRSVPGSPAR